MKQIKAYYHFVDEFQHINYEGLETEDNESIKIVSFPNQESLDTFLQTNQLSYYNFPDGRVLIVKDESIYGQLVE